MTDQKKAAPQTAILIINGSVNKNSTTVMAAAPSNIGKMQYPSTQTLWKKELYNLDNIVIIQFYICPPKNLALRVSTLAPPQTMINIVPKIVSDSPEAFRLKILNTLSLYYRYNTYKARHRHKSKGPQRSPKN